MAENDKPTCHAPTHGVRHFILGTAGHIDHGKTSLVKALTGINTDRLPEEQRRGMTIDLGFADLTVGPFHFGIVDVPGHERFVRNMVAGATGMDLALIVVAGDDSVMPQTVEHVEVLQLVGIRHAVVAVTKADLVDDALLQIVIEEIGELLERTTLAGAPIVPVSSVTGRGLEQLEQRLAEVAAVVPERSTAGPFRLAIDRVFTVQGRGTVVTGSVIQGEVHSGATLQLWPGGDTCRVRDMQTHGLVSEALHLGQRAALNLSGVDKAAIERGYELTTPGYLVPSRRIDASLHVLSSAKREVKPFARLRICMGTRELAARVVPFDGRAIAAGATVWVQLRCRGPMFGTFGQRFIARNENGTRTVGGGVIVRPHTGRWTKNHEVERRALETIMNGSPADRLRQVISECGFESPDPLTLSAHTAITPADLPQMLERVNTEARPASIDGTERRFLPEVIENLRMRAGHRLERYHALNPDEPGCPVDAFVGWLERSSTAGLGKPLFGKFRREGLVTVRGRFVCLPAFAPQMSAQDERLYQQMVDAFRQGRFQPPSLDELAKTLNTDAKRLRRLAKLAAAYGELAEIDGTIFLASEHETDMRRVVREMIEQSGGVSVADVRARLDSSRKYAVPFMEYLDRIRFTVRKGDVRLLHNEVSA